MIKYFFDLDYYKDDGCLFRLGTFSCLKNARKKQKQVENQPGFRDNPNNFKITRCGVKFDDNAVVKKSEARLYCVWLEYEETIDGEIYDSYFHFGYYATEREAQEALEYQKKHFRYGKNHQDGFEMELIHIDNYNVWSKGFVPWDE